jgi:hypothetical protein
MSQSGLGPGGRLGIPVEVRLAGELHDVGKVAIPNGILSKPGGSPGRSAWWWSSTR